MIDYLAGGLELTGLYVLGNRNRYGFALNLAAGACWIGHVYTTGESHGLLLVVVPALFINLRNIIKWG